MELAFTKMQGCANDYIYLDCRAGGVPENIEALSQRLSARHFSVGSDGVICICAPEAPGADAAMRMYNADGSEGRMCGNGIRCVAQWLREHEPSLAESSQLHIDTRSGRKTLTHCADGRWRVDMGRYSTMAADLPAVGMGPGPLVSVPLEADGRCWTVTCISVGNPHCVTVVPAVAPLRLEDIGPAFETNAHFPQHINTEFVEVVDSRHLRMRVWERGSGETYACGTGTCATVAAMTEQGICPRGVPVQVELRGGVLEIEISADGGICMTGPAVTVYEGVARL